MMRTLSSSNSLHHVAKIEERWPRTEALVTPRMTRREIAGARRATLQAGTHLWEPIWNIKKIAYIN